MEDALPQLMKLRSSSSKMREQEMNKNRFSQGKPHTYPSNETEGLASSYAHFKPEFESVLAEASKISQSASLEVKSAIDALVDKVSVVNLNQQSLDTVIRVLRDLQLEMKPMKQDIEFLRSNVLTKQDHTSENERMLAEIRAEVRNANGPVISKLDFNFDKMKEEMKEIRSSTSQFRETRPQSSADTEAPFFNSYLRFMDQNGRDSKKDDLFQMIRDYHSRGESKSSSSGSESRVSSEDKDVRKSSLEEKFDKLLDALNKREELGANQEQEKRASSHLGYGSAGQNVPNYPRPQGVHPQDQHYFYGDNHDYAANNAPNPQFSTGMGGMKGDYGQNEYPQEYASVPVFRPFVRQIRPTNQPQSQWMPQQPQQTAQESRRQPVNEHPGTYNADTAVKAEEAANGPFIQPSLLFTEPAAKPKPQGTELGKTPPNSAATATDTNPASSASAGRDIPDPETTALRAQLEAYKSLVEKLALSQSHSSGSNISTKPASSASVDVNSTSTPKPKRGLDENLKSPAGELSSNSTSMSDVSLDTSLSTNLEVDMAKIIADVLNDVDTHPQVNTGNSHQRIHQYLRQHPEMFDKVLKAIKSGYTQVPEHQKYALDALMSDLRVKG